MPYPNFYAPLDWYDPSYRTPSSIGPSKSTAYSRTKDYLSSLFSEVKKQPAVRTALFPLMFPFNEREPNPLWEAEAETLEPLSTRGASLRAPTAYERASGKLDDIVDELGQNIPIQAMAALLGTGKGAANRLKAATRNAKKTANRAARQEKVIADVVAESKGPNPLAPASGVSGVEPLRVPGTPAGKRKYVVRNGELIDVTNTSRTSAQGSLAPTALKTTEGPVKRNLLEPAAKMVNRPSLAYVRQQAQEAGYLPDLMAPKQLEAPKARFYAGPRGIADAKNPVPFGGGTADLTPIARRPDLPELPNLDDIGSPKKPDILRPLAGRKESLIPNASGNIGSALQDYGYRAISDRIRNDSRAGAIISDMLTTTRLQEESLAGTLKAASRANRAAIEKLYRKGDKGLWDEFVNGLDKGAPVRPELQPIVEAERKRLADLGARAEASGMGFKTAEGKLLKFQSRENYWPHQYGDDFYKNQETQIAALVKRYEITPEEANKIIIRAKEHGGRLIPENEAVRAQMAKRGERYISEQHTRELDLEGFLKTPEALDRHYTNMAKRIVEAENYGPMDIADATSPIGRLLKQTNDEPAIRAYLERVLGRELKPNAPKSKFAKATSSALKAEAAAHLSLFPVSNAQQLAALPLQTRLSSTAKALGNKLIDRTGVKSRAFKGGAMEAADTDALQEMGGKSTINKIFGMGRSERTVRSAGNEAGQIDIVKDFDLLKQGKASDKIRNRLEDRTRTPVNQLLSQDKLTQEQINLAGARVAEITMGRAQAMDLPYGWSSGPGSNMLLLFKKYGYRQAHTMVNAIKENPIRNVPLALLGFQVAGETAGDIKAGIKGAVSGLIKEGAPIKGAWEAIKDRGQWMKANSKNPAVNRIIDNYMQAWLLGLPADAAAAFMRSDSDALRLLGGPVTSDIVDIGRGLADIVTKGDSTRLVTKAARSIPYIGAGIADTMKKPTKGAASSRRISGR